METDIDIFKSTQPTAPQPPTFADVIAEILSRQGQGIYNSHASYQIWEFLKENDIKDYAGLEQHLKNLMSQQRTISHALTPLRKRRDKLAEHIKENDNYQQR